MFTVFLITYLIIAVFMYVFVNFMVTSEQEVNMEFDRDIGDERTKMFALLIISAIWPISICMIMFNNLVNKE